MARSHKRLSVSDCFGNGRPRRQLSAISRSCRLLRLYAEKRNGGPRGSPLRRAYNVEMVPPSIRCSEPETEAARGDARKTIRSATS